MIYGIMKEGVWISDPSQIKEEFLNFFKEKFKNHDLNVDFPPFAISSGLCALDRDSLETPVSLDEVKNAVNIFLDTGSLPHGFNSSFFTLIPKVSNPIFIKDFRPISLIGVHYKIIAKILANRLAKVVDKIVSHEQSAFIAGCQIHDDPLILSDIVERFKKKKKKLLIFKVDFEKAFDSVSWKYLDFVLLNLGFGSKWRSWIRACLSSSRASVLVNGSPTSEFSIKRGLRQGDLLSPFLFILVMEGLHNALSTVVSSGPIRGVKFGSHELTISYLFYVDDKSNVYGIGVSDFDDSSMTSNSGCASRSFPFTYLGLPIGSNMSLKSSWQVVARREKDYLIIDRIDHGQWRWNWSRPILGSQNSVDLLDMLFEISSAEINEAISCPSCNGNVESSSHIFFECNITTDIWMLVRKWCDISFPPITSYEDWKVALEVSQQHYFPFTPDEEK
ncbi:putative RNA-directed DNA polymerase, eukaryota, reverse transcriptase zinc-binding domain protein [Tanacetum coccineum]|uniref:RNA-directed DNA polymerase, eukaryota, reverse transcriptase zinc-binding domain protein n=1 Tax=Tanacetum coccineum TaxID=301880 RepID=A0ABQ5AGF4_9ASTR